MKGAVVWEVQGHIRGWFGESEGSCVELGSGMGGQEELLQVQGTDTVSETITKAF